MQVSLQIHSEGFRSMKVLKKETEEPRNQSSILDLSCFFLCLTANVGWKLQQV